LYGVASSSGGYERRHIVGDHRAVAEDTEPHPIIYYAPYKFFKIASAKDFTAFDGDVRNCATVQFLKKTKPFTCGQISSYISRAGKMAAIGASKIAPVSYG
jgi:hypothetical protein